MSLSCVTVQAFMLTHTMITYTKRSVSINQALLLGQESKRETIIFSCKVSVVYFSVVKNSLPCCPLSAGFLFNGVALI